MAFYAITWSIWLHKNDMIFNGKIFYICQITDIINLRINSWLQAKWPNNKVSVVDFCRYPNFDFAPKLMKKKRVILLWSKPLAGSLNFNMDGLILANLDRHELVGCKEMNLRL